MTKTAEEKRTELIVVRDAYMRAEGDPKMAAEMSGISITPARVRSLATLHEWDRLVGYVTDKVKDHYLDDTKKRRDDTKQMIAWAKQKLMQNILGSFKRDDKTGEVLRVLIPQARAKSLESCVDSLLELLKYEARLFGDVTPGDDGAGQKKGTPQINIFQMIEAAAKSVRDADDVTREAVIPGDRRIDDDRGNGSR